MSAPLFLTLDEVVARYRNQISEGTFRNWRCKRIGPSFIKIGKAVLYPLDELDRWDRSNLVSCQRTRFLPFDDIKGERQAD
ncbi:helix-turn-helix transcriptional regulator [Bosea thiooxidans]|nr:DNA-binding protein [Bosea sp. (in: a-proteobacteria)]